MITGTASDVNPGNSIAYTDWSVDTLEKFGVAKLVQKWKFILHFMYIGAFHVYR